MIWLAMCNKGFVLANSDNVPTAHIFMFTDFSENCVHVNAVELRDTESSR